MLLPWLRLITGWLLLAAYARIWIRTNPGSLIRRGHPAVRRPPRWTYLILASGTVIAVIGAADLGQQPIGLWALLILIGGAILAFMIPIALHNRSVRRVADDPHP